VSIRCDEGSEHGETIPEIRPWREAGWIFKDGDALAIERRDDRTRRRAARKFDQHDE
jgi:hypothetical protein